MVTVSTPLQQISKFVARKASLLQDVGERRSLDWTVRRNHELQRLYRSVLLQPDMATPLPHHDPSITSQRPNHFVVVQAGDLAHRATSTTSTSGPNTVSSSTGSR